MKLIQTDDVRDWYNGSESLSHVLDSIGARDLDEEYVESVLGMPLHLHFIVEQSRGEHPDGLPSDAFDSFPFYSLCKGLFLPLSSMARDRAAQLFGLQTADPPDAAARQALVAKFLASDIGLGFGAKIACLLGDPFYGNRGGLRRDSLVRILHRVGFSKQRETLDQLARVGDVAILFAQNRPDLKADPPLTAAEVLETLRLVSRSKNPISLEGRSADGEGALPPSPFQGEGRGEVSSPGRTLQLRIVTSLLERCGKLEAYFLAKLLLRKAGFGFEYDGDAICQMIGERFGAGADQVAHAVALTDTFHIIRLLEAEGPDALRKITLQPLVPIRPALASGTVDELKQFPVWVERKYDGIRLTLHKSTDARGSVLCGAYTRNRLDWLEMVPGLDATIKLLPAANAIVDGELYGTVFDLDGVRVANVYEVYAAMHGRPPVPVTMRFAGFDLLYLNGQDVTARPQHERRRLLQGLLAPLAQYPTPIAMTLAEGQLASNKEDLNRLFHHFRAQGYEGIVSKDPSGPYRLGQRDPSWLKRKPEVTLDLVLLGAVLAVTAKENAGKFGSYVIGARATDGTYVDVGDVAGVDRERDLAIQQEIFRDGLLTGRQIERPSASGVRPGYELRPGIVVTVRFEGITRESTGKLALRDPKLVAIRSDKNPGEADLVTALEEAYLRQRVG
jgi:DNA ligase-1